MRNIVSALIMVFLILLAWTTSCASAQPYQHCLMPLVGVVTEQKVTITTERIEQIQAQDVKPITDEELIELLSLARPGIEVRRCVLQTQAEQQS